jgi:hypothetical protein
VRADAAINELHHIAARDGSDVVRCVSGEQAGERRTAIRTRQLGWTMERTASETWGREPRFEESGKIGGSAVVLDACSTTSDCWL